MCLRANSHVCQRAGAKQEKQPETWPGGASLQDRRGWAKMQEAPQQTEVCGHRDSAPTSGPRSDRLRSLQRTHPCHETCGTSQTSNLQTPRFGAAWNQGRTPGESLCSAGHTAGPWGLSRALYYGMRCTEDSQEGKHVRDLTIKTIDEMQMAAASAEWPLTVSVMSALQGDSGQGRGDVGRVHSQR